MSRRGSWHDIEEYTDPSTGVTYKTKGYRKKERFGGSRKKREMSRIKAKGMGGDEMFDYKEVGTYRASDSKRDRLKKIRQKTGGDDEWGVSDFTKHIERTSKKRWMPGKTFDISDPESVKDWIRGLGAGAGTKEGGIEEGWFRQKARGLKEGMKGIDLEDLIEESGDVVGIAGKKTGED